MRRIIPFIMLAMAATPLAARADITSRMTSSVQLQVNAAATQMKRIGSSFSITGNNVDTTDGTTANTVSAGTIANLSASLRHSLKLMQLIQLDLTSVMFRHMVINCLLQLEL